MTRNHPFHAAAISVAALLLAGLAGCTSKLDTGYEPRKLGASDEARRGFYAQPFTPEATAAKRYEQDFGDVRKPRPGY